MPLKAERRAPANAMPRSSRLLVTLTVMSSENAGEAEHGHCQESAVAMPKEPPESASVAGRLPAEKSNRNRRFDTPSEHGETQEVSARRAS